MTDPNKLTMFKSYYRSLHGKYPFTLRSMPEGFILSRPVNGKFTHKRVSYKAAVLLLTNSEPTN
jgi:hypothetical protein